MAAGEVPAPTPDVLQQWPLLALFLGVIYALRAALEVAGVVNKNLTGISKFFSARVRQETQIDGRVAALKQQVEILSTTVTMLNKRTVEQAEEVRLAHMLTDAQGRAIREHLAWDRRLLTMVRQALPEFEFPDPPELYVFIDDDL